MMSQGQFVTVRGDNQRTVYMVLEILETVRGPVARLTGVSDESHHCTQDVPVSSLERWCDNVASIDDAVSLIAAHDWEQGISQNSSAAFTCRTEFKPFQFRPLLKFNEIASRRLLVADETGLGKTIESGYIIVEDIAKHRSSRIVILCPSRLRYKWRRDMWRKFGLPFRVVRGRTLLELLRSDSQVLLLIASLDCARSIDADQVNQVPLAGKCIDLLVIDEVHRLIGRVGETNRRRLGLACSRSSKGIIGLSATPVQIDTDDLLRVLDIVAPGELSEQEFISDLNATAIINRIRQRLSVAKWDSEIEAETRGDAERLLAVSETLEGQVKFNVEGFARDVLSSSEMAESEGRRLLRNRGLGCTRIGQHVNRTKGVEVGESRKRIIKTVEIDLSKEDRNAYRNGKQVSTSEYKYFKDLDRLFEESFSHVHRQQLASCLPAMRDLIQLGLRGQRAWRARERDEGENGDAETDSSDAVVRKCMGLLDISGLKPRDSKFKALVECLERIVESGKWRKAILFTHWIPTFRYLSEHLVSLKGIKVIKVSPDYDDRRVEGAIEEFAEAEGFSVLLTTDILKEGFDLDAADCVINYDFSYNPQDTEQRIGRIDRVCQKSREILVVNLVVRESLDDIVYTKVIKRIGLSESAMGDMKPITAEMADRLEREGRIDESEVTRVATLLGDREVLMNHEVFSIVEEAFDDEILQAHAQKGNGIVPLYWTFLRRFFEIVCPDCRCRWDDESKHLMVEGVTRVAEDAIYSLAGQDMRELVEWTMHAAKREDGTLEFSFGGGKQSLPLTDPLVSMAANTVSAFYSNSSDHNECAMHVMTQRFSDISVRPDVDILMLVQFRYDGEHLCDRETRLYTIGHNGDVAHEEGLLASRLLEILMDDEGAKVIGRCCSDDAHLKSVDEDFATWSSLRAERDSGLQRIELERERRIISGMILEQTRGDGHCDGESRQGDQYLSRLLDRLAELDRESDALGGRQTLLRPPGIASWRVVLEVGEVVE